MSIFFKLPRIGRDDAYPWCCGRSFNFTKMGTPGSKMKCNALECLLKIQAQKGVANEKVPSINSSRKRKDSDAEAIGVLNNEDCRSA